MSLLSACLLLFANPVSGEVLERQIQSLTKNVDAQVGVAVIIDGKDTIVVNDGVRYPLMSVMKFHQALAVADFLWRTGGGLDDRIKVDKDMLKSNTYSPLRDKYPAGGVFTVRKLMDYSLQLSDNNACDILFAHIGGSSAVDSFLCSVLGCEERNFAVKVTEDDMHRDLDLCYDNWSSPLAAALLVERFLVGDILRPDLQEYIKSAMIDCSTGADRLPAPLKGTGAVIGHKTGTGDRNVEGRIIGFNDLGFVLLPDGRRYTIAVFIRDMAGDSDYAVHLIAGISDMVYKYVLSKAK